MTRYCPECGGVLHYDTRLKRYICKSCGLSLSSQELIELRDRLKPDFENDKEKRKKKHKDYLDWWFSERERS